MFANGQIDIIHQDGQLYINMWQMTQHLMSSAYILKDEGADYDAALFGILIKTLCDLAIYELDKGQIDNVDEIVSQWLDIKE